MDAVWIGDKRLRVNLPRFERGQAGQVGKWNQRFCYEGVRGSIVNRGESYAQVVTNGIKNAGTSASVQKNILVEGVSAND